MQAITTAQAERLLDAYVAKQMTVLLMGPTGCAKSAILYQVMSVHCQKVYVFHPAVHDPTVYGGFPWFYKNGGPPKAELVPYGDFADVLTATEPTGVIFDDVGHAPKAVQGALMQVIGDRRLNGKAIPACVSFGLASNRRVDKVGADGVLDTIIRRCHGVFEIKPDLDTFKAYWVKTGKRQEVMAFLHKFPAYTHAALMAKGGRTTDYENFPTYPTWAFVSDILDLNLDRDTERAGIAGAVGEGVAGEFTAYLSIYQDMPDPDEVLKNPLKAPIPKKPDLLYAFCLALAYRANDKTFEAISQYLERLAKEGYEEQAMCLLADCLTREPKLQDSKDAVRVISGKLGKLFRGGQS